MELLYHSEEMDQATLHNICWSALGHAEHGHFAWRWCEGRVEVHGRNLTGETATTKAFTSPQTVSRNSTMIDARLLHGYVCGTP